jgi:thiamine biosynthesis protein ThiS
VIIQVNGELREVDEALSLSNLIDQLELSPQRVAIELNKEVVRRSNWNSIVLRENDRVEIVHFVGGGCAFASTRESV